ncbi:MAG: flavin reductase [Floccifex sp.]
MFKPIDLHSLSFNPFDKIGKEWFLITAKNENKVNTMTASWGALGHLWNKDIIIAFIRPQRYTKQFIDQSEAFTLSFFEDHHKELSYLGTKSGKDEDKISHVNFHITEIENLPTFEEAKDVFLIKKLYVGKFEKDNFLYSDLYDKNYPNDDLHYIYIGEITGVYSHE